MSTATKLGSALGASALAFALMGAPALAVPDGDPAKNHHGQATAAEASERSAENRDEPAKENGTAATEEDAAPGGADRATESGHSGTQGRSESNPDAEREGQSGVDKPYDAAGEARFTQWDDSDADGNNGCGNDTNFEDDNNGNCGGRVKAQSNVTEPEVRPLVETGTTETQTAVLGVRMERAEVAPQASASAAAVEAAPAQVLGVQMERGSAASALARTGLPLALVALVGFGLVGGGALLRRFATS